MNLFVEKTYDVTLILMACTTLLTGLGSTNPIELRAKVDLQLSTMVTAIASCHYVLMRSAGTNRSIIFRYLDWFFTTPLLLLKFLRDTDNEKIIQKVVTWNLMMLLVGFLGELGYVDRTVACAIGFGLLLMMYKETITSARTKDHVKVKTFYLLWSAYGLVYLQTDVEFRIIAYNLLDLLSKAGYGFISFLAIHELHTASS